MTRELRERLQTTLGGAYTLERELGGGGMSRVFVARDEGIGRTVVVKVLAPELAEGLSAERFTREVRLAARLQHPNIVPVLAVGTPAYMAPEQAAGEDYVDHRADLYAWGLVAWEALAGRHPFADRTSPLALIGAQVTQVPAPLATVRGDVPPALAALVARCLAREPAERPADACEVLRALEDAPHAREASAPERPLLEEDRTPSTGSGSPPIGDRPRVAA